jgi:hypothetical protein
VRECLLLNSVDCDEASQLCFESINSLAPDILSCSNPAPLKPNGIKREMVDMNLKEKKRDRFWSQEARF